MANFLFELGVEEIPAGYILPALADMAEKLKEILAEENLGSGEVLTVGTPRRLTLYCEGITEGQEDREETVTGPPARIARDDDGNWTKPALGFAKSQGVDADALFITETPKGEYVAAKIFVKGRTALEVLSEALGDVVRSARFPKSMKWTEDRTSFARPVYGIVALLDCKIVPFEFTGVKSGRTACGHPFLAPEPFDLESADFEKYKQLLRERFVIADFNERRSVLAGQIEKCAAENNWIISHKGLLDEVTNLLENPNILVGSFKDQYLDIPEEVLVEAMTSHQRYFPVRDKATGRLVPRFVTGFNRKAEHEQTIREGNERVLTARLKDAEFFFGIDRKTLLADRLEALEHVVYQEKLGSYRKKAERMETLSGSLAQLMGLNNETTKHATRAALLAKADLVTEMVGEFAKLEGAMGRVYALIDGEDDEVAQSIGEHYLPRSADDPVPATDAGMAAALSDKLDALAGCFWAGLEPTGSADPYALRRAAQGVIRIIIERKITFPLNAALAKAVAPFEPDVNKAADIVKKVIEFIRDRFYHMMIDKGNRYDIVRSVLAVAPGNDLLKTVKRMAAVNELATREDWPRLVTVVERLHNITKEIATTTTTATTLAPTADLLCEKAELDLHAHWIKIRPKFLKLAKDEKYVKASALFSGELAELLHNFFEDVFVNVDDKALRANRLALLADIRDAYETNIAVLTEIQSNDAAQGIPGKANGA